LATREVNDNNLLLYSTLMENIIAGSSALANIDLAVNNTLEIMYTKNLLNKCIQQQQDGCDSHGWVYSRSSSNRAASTGNRAVAAAPAVNLQNCPPLDPV
jgi:hypothetical protein